MVPLPRRTPTPNEVNFWRPSAATAFRSLRTGEPFLFKTRHPENQIVGGGFFSGFASLRVSEAWDFYGEGNGTPSLQMLLGAIDSYRQDHVGPDSEIGCILLRDVSFFDPHEEVPGPTDFAKNIVQGKGYELETLPPDHEAVQAFYRLVQPGVYRLEPEQVAGAVFGEDHLTRTRLGQQGCKAMVTASYQRRCAVTGDRIRPVLQASHIRPVAAGGENRLDNGLLLRSDVHTLFDRGYLGLDTHHQLRVSARLREEFDNGLDFYALAGQEIALPHERRSRPSEEFVEWHHDMVFLG